MESLEPVEPFVTRDVGVFDFPSVPAGEWSVLAEGEPLGDGPSGYGAATISLGHGDPDDLKIQLAAPFRLSGVVEMGDGSAPPANLILGMSLYSDTGRAGSGGMTEPGKLRLDVVPGANQILADVLFGNYYVDSILVGSTDMMAQRIELTPASPAVKLILKPAGTVHGTIEDGGTGTIIVFPKSFTGVGYYAQSGAGSSFELAGIPRGDYYVIAVDRFDPRTMAGAVRLRSLMPMAASVKVQSASSANVRLRVNRFPD